MSLVRNFHGADETNCARRFHAGHPTPHVRRQQARLRSEQIQIPELHQFRGSDLILKLDIRNRTHYLWARSWIAAREEFPAHPGHAVRLADGLPGPFERYG